MLRAIVACLAIGAGLVVAELLVRVGRPQDLEVMSAWYESHPVYRFRHFPNMDKVKRAGPERYRIRTNRQGVRADEDEAYASPLETRIVVHGDSYVFGVGVDNRDTFIYRTQESLRRKLGRVDVLNLGVGNTGPSEQYLLFLEEGRKYLPRIVVVGVAWNDLDDVTRPLNAFRLQHNRLVYVPYRPSVLRRLSERPLYRWVQDRSHLLTLLRGTLANAMEGDRFVPSAEAEASSLPQALAVYRAFVTAIRRENAVPLILLLPSMEQVASGRMELAGEPSVSARLLMKRLREFCAEEAVPCLDTLEAFVAADVPTGRLFIPRDEHYTAAGHGIVTGLLEPRLERMLESLRVR